MLGQLAYQCKGNGRPRRISLYGLPVLRTEIPPSGLWHRRRLNRAAWLLARQKVRRVLVPKGFAHWSILAQFGLCPVDPAPLLRTMAAPLALAALGSMGVDPRLATVTLLGQGTDGDMARAAEVLCPLVRRLSLPQDRRGLELSNWLRREYGVPVLPAANQAHLSVSFDGTPDPAAVPYLDLSRGGEGLGPLILSWPLLADEDQRDLPLLTALWLGGKLSPDQIEITDSHAGKTFSPPSLDIGF